MKAIGEAKKGDIVRFKGHSLRVERDPVRKGTRIQLHGRESRNGCPLVTRWYFANLMVELEGSHE